MSTKEVSSVDATYTGQFKMNWHLLVLPEPTDFIAVKETLRVNNKLISLLVKRFKVLKASLALEIHCASQRKLQRNLPRCGAKKERHAEPVLVH